MSGSSLGNAARLNLFRKEDLKGKLGGKVVLCGSTLEETLERASCKLAEEVVELRSPGGATIDSLALLRDWDVVVAVTKDQVERESMQAATDADTQFDARSIHSALSASSSSIVDLRERVEKVSVVPTSTTSPPPPSPPQPLLFSPPPQPSVVVQTIEPGDFGLQATAFVPAPDAPSRNDWVRLNMGGRIFATTRATLTSDPNSMLARMFESGLCSAIDSTGAFLIDRSPEYFEPLLNFLRHNKLILNEGINPQGVLEEAKFFGISKAIEPLESLIHTEELAVHGQFTRKEFLRMLSITSSSSTLRCQGMDLEGVDLSNLDLRNINFKCANLCKCNLSNSDLTNCVFERADLSRANLDGAVVQCVRMPRVNLEGATLKGCIMDSRMGIHTNLEGANLKGAILDNSQMNGSNLRLASLKGASLRSCNLRYAIMAGTDMENCDLTGCDLQQANLRGSNLAGAILEDIIAPLHMSQTVNVTTISIGGAAAAQPAGGGAGPQPHLLPPPPAAQDNGNDGHHHQQVQAPVQNQDQDHSN